MSGLSRDALVLRALRAAPVHLLAGDLAENLAIPLTDVESAVASLRGAGFDIESKPGLGFALKHAPDRILADDLWARMDEAPLLREIIVYQETSSTNDVALRLGREGHPGGVVVFAERQTAGRGRFGRRWDSADHAGLWFSWMLRPSWPLERWPILTTCAGVAVARALDPFCRSRAQLKWPNDVQIGGRKVAGILIESVTDRQGQPFAVVGIGVNVNQQGFPPDLEALAVSARQAADAPIDRPALAAALLVELGRTWEMADRDFHQIVAEAAARSVILGHWVRLHTGNGMVEGVAEALDPAGHLLVRTEDGAIQTMSAGEVSTHGLPGVVTRM